MIVEMAHAGVLDEAPEIANVLRNALLFLLTISGVAILISFVFSGLFYLFSGGSTKKLDYAKRSFSFSLFGLLIILSSLIILYAVSIVLS